VDWAFNFRTTHPGQGLLRFANPLDGGRYWLSTEWLIDDNRVDDWNHELFFGSQFATNTSELAIYAFWVPKVSNDLELTPVFDLVYFMYFPYNRGKPLLDVTLDNHVGDWEHVTVRTFGGVAGGIYVHAHDFGTPYGWNGYPTYPGTECPRVFCAWGSHGFWADPGDHEYLPGIHDYTMQPVQGRLTRDWVEAYDYQTRQGLSGKPWPRWMDHEEADFTKSDISEWWLPWAGPILHWGNPARNIPYLCTGATCTLANGPTGPWDDDAFRVLGDFK
jgi:hypothetical protein